MRNGRVENWQELECFGGTRLFGNVYECDAFSEGEEFISSIIVKYHNIMGQPVVETQSGSMYHLGQPAANDKTFEEIIKGYLNEDNAVHH